MFFSFRDAHRWEQVPGARRCVRINWKDILPSPTDQWDAHIPVFGLDVPDLKLLGPKDGSVSPGPETSSVGRRATRPATPYPRLTKPSSSYETQPATAKRLIVEVEEEGHLDGFKARMKKQPQNVNRHQPPQGRRETAMQHTLAATIPATYAPKRDRSASAGTDVEEEEYSGGLKIRTHKKVRFNAQQPTRGLADYILTRMPTNKHPVNPTLKRPYSLSTAASTAEDGELHNDNKAKNTSASSGMRNEPRQPQVFATPAQKRPFAQYTSTEPLTDRTRHISEMTTPSARPPKLQRLLFKKSSIGPTEKGSEEHDEEHRSFVFFEFPY